MPNFEVFLKGHAGDTIIVDRIGRSAERIDHPAITMGLTVQPEILRGLSSGRHQLTEKMLDAGSTTALTGSA